MITLRRSKTIMAETVKFPTNIPMEMELKFDTGLECQSQFNGQDQVCYTLANDRRMYLSPAVARKITDRQVALLEAPA